MAIIDLTEVTYTYPATETPALKDFNLKVEEGEFLAVIGANGAGKSTLCYMLAGFIPHFFKGSLSGKVQVAGMDTVSVTLNDVVLKAGLVFQNPFTQISGSKFTVYEEIAFGLENIAVPREEMHDRIQKVMTLTGITDLAKRSPYALSGGQQQRVALASILVMEPAILVLDEPTSQLDPIGTREVFKVIKEMSRKGITIVMAEHKIEWVAQFADRVIALDQGNILTEGKPQDVLTSLLLPQHGVGISRYTAVARTAQTQKLWPVQKRLPITLDEATDGFREVMQ